MITVTISSRYQIAIPKEVRKALHLQPNEKLQIFLYQNRLQLIPVNKNIKNMRGFLRGIDTAID